jgi:catechol 2,3-dioxygenase-like lactoylglutathione lyase family enzyme
MPQRSARPVGQGPVLPFALHHVSYTCADVQATRDFYVNLLGFIDIKRPDAFKFEGCWCVHSLSYAHVCTMFEFGPRCEQRAVCLRLHAGCA